MSAGSGGLIYHLRALRYDAARAAQKGKPSHSIWSQHAENTARFLNAWSPPEKTLILVGPSGGYSLPENFLNRFERVIAIEPDWLARKIFSRRFSSEIMAKVEWVKSAFNFANPSASMEKLPSEAAILFSNLLGQVPFANVKRGRDLLQKVLAGRSYASYHDALSGENLEFDFEKLPAGSRANFSQMKASIYPKLNAGTITVNAHQAPDLFEGLRADYRYWQWQILPKRTHLIEGVFYVKNLYPD